ncbi:MAG TPA: cytochrome c oxidase subunit 3 [Pirellulales bacterium]|jgi:cytochrome c oxidase subunit 3|nr:cytochrome c oxidase subunit 3 [Pirellulales bacterium]
MSPDHGLLTPGERAMLPHTILSRHRLEEQFENLEQQHHVAATGMWVFLATEVMFFGTLFLSLSVYRWQYGEAFEHASERLNWIIGGTNTAVLLVSSFTVVLAVHHAQLGQRKPLMVCLALTALLGTVFLVLKGLEYYIDYRENLIPGWRFVADEWTNSGLAAEQVPQVKLFLVFYWVMTLFHGLHVTIGIVAVLVMLALASRNHFSPAYYSPVDVVALYWHFVDIVWIFLLPMLYLLGTHTL